MVGNRFERSVVILSPWDFPGKNTGVGCHFLLQGRAEVGLNLKEELVEVAEEFRFKDDLRFGALGPG